jgi:hypothetical protein
MITPRSFSRTDFWVFVTPVAVLVVLPLLLWLVVYATQTKDGISSDTMWYLFCGVVLWVGVPSAMFRKPLFDPTMIGYSPHGFLGWLVVVTFWVVISFIISFGVRYFVRSAERRGHI